MLLHTFPTSDHESLEWRKTSSTQACSINIRTLEMGGSLINLSFMVAILRGIKRGEKRQFKETVQMQYLPCVLRFINLGRRKNGLNTLLFLLFNRTL